MKNPIKILICSFLAATMLFSLVGCGKSVVYKTYPDFFGSDVTLVVSGGDQGETERVWKNIIGRLDEIKLSLSADAVADKTALNAGIFADVKNYNALKPGESAEVSFETFAVIEKCKTLDSVSSGAFNPCVKNLSDLWGFTSRFYSGNYEKAKKYDRAYNSVGGFEDPEQKYIEAFITLSDFSSLKAKVVDGKYFLEKTCPSVIVDGEEYFQQIDLSAVAKGYAADKIQPLLSSLVGDYYISFGGSSMYLGENGGGDWDLKVTDPSSRTHSSLGTVKVKNSFVSTAGVYERKYYTESGELRHHIIDAATGKPAETDVLSVTLIGNDCAFSDGLSTALVAKGSAASLDYLENQSEYSYIVVTRDNRIFTNTGLRLEKDSPYTLSVRKSKNYSD